MGLAGVGILLLCRINPELPRSSLIGALMLRAVGPGLAMMPITTSGISALPRRLAGSGSAYNQLVQRSSAALGLAGLTSISTTQTAQMMNDRQGLMAPGSMPTTSPAAVPGAGGHDMLHMYQMLTSLQDDVLTHAYSDVFLISGVVTLAGVVLALLLPRHRA